MCQIQHWVQLTWLLQTCWLIYAIHWMTRHWIDFQSTWYRIDCRSVPQHNAWVENFVCFSIQITSLFICCWINKFDLSVCLDACIRPINSKIYGYCSWSSFPVYHGNGETILKNWRHSWRCYRSLYRWRWGSKQS